MTASAAAFPQIPQLDALKTSMLAVAFLAVLSLWFTRRLPGRPTQAA